MLAVDTNVVVRYLLEDDPDQSPRAIAIMEESEVWISKTVLLETEWVLRGLYKYMREDLVAALKSLGGLQNVRIESSPDVVKALNCAAEGMDFADALHLTGMGEAERFVTFDQKLARRAKKLAAMHVSLA